MWGDAKPDHAWTRKTLEEARNETDAEVAQFDPEILPMPIKCGIAPVLKANIDGAYWGKQSKETLIEKQKSCAGIEGD